MLSAFLVALDDTDRVVGYAGVQVILDEGYITNIAVRPECRRQGVAAKLLQVFLDFAKANKLSFLTLEVRASKHGPAEELLRASPGGCHHHDKGVYRWNCVYRVLHSFDGFTKLI